LSIKVAMMILIALLLGQSSALKLHHQRSSPTEARKFQVHTSNEPETLTLTEKSNCIRRMAFIHIPKVGGRGFQKTMERIIQNQLNISEAEAFGGSDNDRNDLMRSREGKHPYVVGFHTQHPANDIFSKLKKINDGGCPLITATLLRKPMKRTISQINYDMQTKCLPAETVNHTELWFDHFSTMQSRFLAGKHCVACGNFWEKGKVPDHCTDVSDQEMQQTVEMLHSMDVVGVLEDLDSFVIEVVRRMRLQPITSEQLPHEKTKSNSLNIINEQTMSESALNIIKKKNVKEDELYEVAKKLAASYSA